MFAARGLRLLLNCGRIRELRIAHFAGAIVLHLAGRILLHDFEKGLGSLHRGASELAAGARGILCERELREVSSGLIILILRPALEGMVVAFVAIEPGGEEKMRRVFHRLRWLTQDFPVTRRGIIFIGTVGGDDLANELVVWHVFINRAADPCAEAFSALLAKELGVDLKQVTPLVGPVFDEIDAADQLVDDSLALHA